jgi:tetratricopeptide (TPR) repeat protein
MGDGIMALFGAPLAHEDHAVRACYAALRMQDAIRRYVEEVRRTHGIAVRIRVGLNSGEVVVRAIGSDLHMDYTAVGQTTHLAARMEQLAAPGSILLTAETLQLAEGFVQVKPLGPVPVKGLEAPIEVYEVTAAGLVRRRLEAAAIRGLTRFVGREAELETLNQALGKAGTGHGQVVALVGEAGVGKSRLVWEFTHSHRTRGWLLLESGSVSYGKATPYLPVIDLLKAYCQIESRDEPRKIREKVTGKLLTPDRALEPTLPAVLALLDVPVEDPQWQALDKHALTHEVAYGSLLQERRRALHARIVEALEALYPDRLAEQVERLAHHAFRGEAWEKAVTYLRQAGAKALARSAYLEAKTCFEQALAALHPLPTTRQKVKRAIDLRLDLRLSLFPLGELAKVLGYLREAEELSRTLDDLRRLGWVSAYMCGHHVHTGGRVTEMRTFAQRVEGIAERLGDVPLQIAAQYYLGAASQLAGNYRATERVCRNLMQSLPGQQTRDESGLVVSPAGFSRAQVARALAERGVFDEGDAHGREAIRIAEALDHPLSVVVGCLNLAYLESVRGELSQAARLLDRVAAPDRGADDPVDVRGRCQEPVPLRARHDGHQHALRDPERPHREPGSHRPHPHRLVPLGLERPPRLGRTVVRGRAGGGGRA